jgi:hypothetical protein
MPENNNLTWRDLAKYLRGLAQSTEEQQDQVLTALLTQCYPTKLGQDQ